MANLKNYSTAVVRCVVCIDKLCFHYLMSQKWDTAI